MSNILDGLHDRLISELKRVGPLVVSKAAGISRATIYNWMEKGNVPLDKLSLLASAGVDITFVLTGSYVVPEASEYGTVNNADEAEMLAEYRAGDEDARDVARYTLAKAAARKRKAS
ncbi:bacteriophage CI repressor [Salmonella enterica subsp. enterica]|uniref:Bacteriophage CI repressor n=1 Tax=Salmonella enterica subsp. enterica serovar Telelkebir TaxID=1967657 RepID=A0A610C006_SALET|nr:bacteriophage CI repressor [Salmonella enterica subsp. enterica serovar Telelkebir]